MARQTQPSAAGVASAVYQWVDERIEVGKLWALLFLRYIPRGVGWWYTLGFASLFVFINQAVTGALLALYYAPTPDHAYPSILFIMNEVTFGSVVRGLHHWGSSAMVVLVIAHLLVVFAFGAHKYPREATWVIGIFLLLVVLGFSFTGYLLPWDQKAYWATTVGTNMAGTVPFMGQVILKAVRGGAEVGAMTLVRFYAIHTMVLPAILGLLLGLHMFLVIRQGVSVPPRVWHLWRHNTGPRGNDASGAVVGSTPGEGEAKKEPEALEVPEGREEYAARYEALKKQGHPFFPDIVIEDVVVALGVFVGLLILTLVWGVPLEAPADPTDTAYIPRPDWYFLWVFQILRFFPGYLEWVAAILVPGVIFLVLLLLPFYDRRWIRLPRGRPLAVALGTASVVAILALTGISIATTPPSAAEEGGKVLTSDQLRGKRLYADACLSCHAIRGEGGRVGPPLDGVAQRLDPVYIHSYIEAPRRLNPKALMPAFLESPDTATLTHRQVEQIVQYLETTEPLE